jgi:hypothetical protein
LWDDPLFASAVSAVEVDQDIGNIEVRRKIRLTALEALYREIARLREDLMQRPLERGPMYGEGRRFLDRVAPAVAKDALLHMYSTMNS